MYFRQSALLSGAFAALVMLSLSAAPAAAHFDRHYDVTISTAPTQNMKLHNGLFSPTGGHPNLNVSDLQNALANGTTEVTTGSGYGGYDKGDLFVEAGFTWSATNQLVLYAYHSVVVDQPIADASAGAELVIEDNNGGFLSFGKSGSISIADLSSGIRIDGQFYTLVGDIKTLATDVLKNPQGSYALANSYDASADGTYSQIPVGQQLEGNFEGLGNAISNLSVSTTSSAGLFYATARVVSDLGLINVAIASSATGGTTAVGALAAFSNGLVRNCYSNGTVSASAPDFGVGGLIGSSSAGGGENIAVENSYSTAQVNATGSGVYAGGLIGFADAGGTESSYATGLVAAGPNSIVGGLVGFSEGTTRKSFATGSVSVGKWDGTTPLPASAGGLIGYNAATKGYPTPIANSFALGGVTGGAHAVVGGLIGLDSLGTYKKDYATGAVAVGKGDLAGGFIGSRRGGTANDGYWDITTSGTTNATGRGAMGGVTGLTTQQLQSGLPEGFDPRIWAENPGFNNGFPYLIANPPPQ